MPSEIAFDWRPGLLEWLLVLEIVVLLVLAVYRYLARLIGRSSPTDWFVIFYKTFWRAFRTPRRYPVPVNYQPVLPKVKKPKLEEPAEGVGLTDEEIERLMSESGEAGQTQAREMSMEEALAALRHADLHVRVVTGMTTAVRSVEEGTVTISVNVAPDDGRANRLVIQQLCTMLHLKPHQISIQSGHTRADKSLRITGLSGEELERKLQELGRAPEETIGFAPGE